MKHRAIALLLAALMLMGLSAPALAASNVYFSGACNVRSGPGTGYESLGMVNKGATLRYWGDSEYSNGYTWYNVDYHGQSGWVSSKYASLTDYGGIATYASDGDGASYDSFDFGRFGYGASVYINGDCNVRSGPSLSHDTLGTARQGSVLTGLGTIRTDSRGIEWYSVSFRDQDGWVSSTYASLSGFEDYAINDYGRYVVGVSGDSNVRTGPGLDYGKLGVLYEGSSAAFLGQTSVDERGVEWYRISWKDSAGWVSSRYTALR